MMMRPPCHAAVQRASAGGGLACGKLLPEKYNRIFTKKLLNIFGESAYNNGAEADQASAFLQPALQSRSTGRHDGCRGRGSEVI